MARAVGGIPSERDIFDDAQLPDKEGVRIASLWFLTDIPSDPFVNTVGVVELESLESCQRDSCL